MTFQIAAIDPDEEQRLHFQKLAALLTTPVLDRTGFHGMFCWLQKDVRELGYGSVLEFIAEYEEAQDLLDMGLLDDFMPPEVDE